jgi:asparagine N-glycosylation enzyme membrane subunit Stt3
VGIIAKKRKSKSKRKARASRSSRNSLGSMCQSLASCTHRYAFKLCALLAVVLGIASAYLDPTTKSWVFTVLVVCGGLAGYFNISDGQREDFLITALVAVLVLAVGGVTFFSQMLYVGEYLVGIINGLLIFIVPATVVAAFKHIFALLAD